MVKLVEMESRRDPESDLEAQRRRNSFVWVWVVLAIVSILAVGGLMSFAAKGLTQNNGRIDQDRARIEDVAKDAAKGNGRTEPPTTPPQQ